MKATEITVLNCCEGNLAKAFDEAVSRAAEDIDRRGSACTETRKVVITVEFTPNKHGLVEQTCYADVKLPKVRYGGMAQITPQGRMAQIVSGQLDAFDPEKNAKIISMEEKKEAAQQ